MVKLSSIPHEYYLGDLPGSLQYSKDVQDIIDTNLESDIDDTCGYVLCEQSHENLMKVTPITQQKTDWSILLMMRKEGENGEIWLKAALLNRNTGKVALLTSTNNRMNLEKRGHRPVKTIDGIWFVGHYRMSAPIVFWRELKNRLLY
jgi:hypothetical protein